MAKKGKQNAEAKNIKSVKDKVKEDNGKVDKGKSRKCLNVILISSAVITVLLSITAFHLYSCFTHIPELPAVDLDEYWGPSGTQVKDTSIRPFKIVFTDAMQDEIRTLFELYRRVEIPNETARPASFNETGWTYGVNSGGFTEFFTNWIFNYNFRERAKFLNKFDQFKTNIQGLDIHFIHVKPEIKDKNVKVVPLLLLHGWPSSVREFYEVIPRLTSPKKGYKFAFEVIVPSLPGFTYSQGASKPGLSTVKIAVIMRNLMQRLGHNQFYIQGGDFGHMIGSHIATLFPKEVLGFHTNLPANFSKYAFYTWILGGLWPSLVADKRHVEKMYPVTDKLKFFLEESGYMHLQSTKPDTIGIALSDSPVGLASYIIDRIMVFTDPENKNRSDGGLDKYFSMDKLIDNIMMYWDTKSITTSMRLYKESVANSEMEQIMAKIPTPVPVWALRFKHELIHHPDFILRWKYPNLVGSNSAEYGGHFAALERPKTFSDDVFLAVKMFRGEFLG